ncbi:GntR family transcriptional regulator [Treponema parvum]|uniref:GntR family transcriptional regulator n=1 Tax=Treponema parvum TaxID=138851 RepID=A0A975F1G1_9SPIR|nr:GntR family transcriptional regulator [Treponema parvum]QTQ12633.1 GntR family transcriptional regulator [Treponema parvum]QTQ15390.1 GntR family transcriptional regulator [Treponema parvum]
MEKDLDFSGRTQLYFQLYDKFYEKIKNGEYPPGTLLPTETEIMEQYKISRITVRKAMDMLLNDGLIVKKRGYGTCVQNKKVEQTMQRVLHFSEEMRKKGIKTYTKMIHNEVISATMQIAKALNLPEGTKLAHVYRLRYANDIPMCIESAYLELASCPDVPNHDFSVESLRKFLKDTYNIQWAHARQKIFAINANSKLAKQLDIPHNNALIFIERVSYTEDGRPGEFLQGYYRGDSYYLTTELQA